MTLTGRLYLDLMSFLTVCQASDTFLTLGVIGPLRRLLPGTPRVHFVSATADRPIRTAKHGGPCSRRGGYKLGEQPLVELDAQTRHSQTVRSSIAPFLTAARWGHAAEVVTVRVVVHLRNKSVWTVGLGSRYCCACWGLFASKRDTTRHLTSPALAAHSAVFHLHLHLHRRPSSPRSPR
jgi:hypothetical protein